MMALLRQAAVYKAKIPVSSSPFSFWTSPLDGPPKKSFLRSTFIMIQKLLGSWCVTNVLLAQPLNNTAPQAGRPCVSPALTTTTPTDGTPTTSVCTAAQCARSCSTWNRSATLPTIACVSARKVATWTWSSAASTDAAPRGLESYTLVRIIFSMGGNMQ